MKVVGNSFNSRVIKILVAAQFAGVKLEQEDYAPRQASEEAKQAHLKINPNGKIPVLVTEHGPLFESNTILRYIARQNPSAKLYGNSKYEESVVDQHLDWLISSWEPVYNHVVMPITGRRPYNKEVHDKAVESLKEMLKMLEEILKVTEYLVGKTITIADIFLVQTLNVLFRYVFDEKARKPFPNLVKYYLNLANNEHFKKVIGKPALCKNALKPYVDPAEAAAAAAAAAAKKKKGKDDKKGGDRKDEKKEEKKEPEAAPQKTDKKAEKADKKAEKKDPAPKKEAAPKKPAKEAEDDEDDEPKEKKEKNPLDALPPSSFNLFDFKTLFVNAPDKKEAYNTFLQQFDPQGYSCWHMEYDKAEGEGRVVFLTSNLMNGFLQRLETFRKYAFGVVGVYGEEPELQIRGGWVWRGNEVPFEIKDHPSGEWYKFKKLDVVNNEADRKQLEEYWCKQNEDEDIVDGLRARDVKYYK